MTTRTRNTVVRRVARAVAAACVIPLAIVACGDYTGGGGGGTADSATQGPRSSWPEILSAADTEGKLEVWSVLSPAHNAAVEAAFEKAYPKIDLTITQYGPPDISTRVDAEHQAGVSSVDVLLSTDRMWHGKHLTDGYFQKIVGPDVAAADKLLLNGAPPTTNGAPTANQALYDDNTRLITLFAAWGYAWNTDAVKTPPPSFDALFSGDTYKGKIGMNDPNTNSVNTVLFGKLSERYPNLFQRLGALRPTLYASSGPASEALGAGAVDAVLAISGAAVAPVKKAGFAFDSKFPALATPLYAEVLAASQSPNAAQVFTNWLMTVDGQTAWTAGYASVLPNIPTANNSAAGVEVFEAETVDPNRVAAWRDQLNTALGR
ncbi:extracellular solute-binding protein [Pseudonocardia kujensis]|uniref:ABC transporter substrate-binding protein n=1 Tax=Pseudonocardia kujensis TaxID=1128675 RepID=UPI001E5412EE|nr:ABC transporter substrate-binding protein [Pseudonocardia kujensis]MCE0765989.1 extracellular solute-binding protein [Pseudonocardia kujensis]